MTRPKPKLLADRVSVEQTQVDVMWLEEFPPCTFTSNTSSTLQIAAYIRTMLETRQGEQATSLVIPSIMELSSFFQRSELDIMDAFSELKNQGYALRIPGLDGLITIWDPLIRHQAKPPSLLQQWVHALKHLLGGPDISAAKGVATA